ncbi:MAG TPA: hypothetical protein VFV38_18025 [Ktedonobacteraceae bacterium]|nr:hypothetical protein [Ktedonobacteraceae bacterium]
MGEITQKKLYENEHDETRSTVSKGLEVGFSLLKDLATATKCMLKGDIKGAMKAVDSFGLGVSPEERNAHIREQVAQHRGNQGKPQTPREMYHREQAALNGSQSKSITESFAEKKAVAEATRTLSNIAVPAIAELDYNLSAPSGVQSQNVGSRQRSNALGRTA